ncbi:hyaluronidase A [Vespa crabro]|uniref:hyaluronidase A n=1 Tax=Vespa crabro TaxID=7445 RepID=UPI001F0039A4|nr:hyaluronidase A [Vespa crabro]
MLLVILFLYLLHPLVNGNLNRTNWPKKIFNIYWNVPTYVCHQHGVYFNELTKFDIKYNSKGNYRGETISLFYDPGNFPAMVPLKNGTYDIRNEGVPQKGNITVHLQQFTKELDEIYPKKISGGIGVINFNKWRPIFRRNVNNLKIIKEVSIDLVRKEHPKWDKSMIETEASNRFEKSARIFMEKTLKLAKNIRDKNKWGYHGYPYCPTASTGNPSFDCDALAMNENDKLSWLFKYQDVLLPSVYVKHVLKPEEKIGLVRGNVKEAVRISKKFEHLPKVLSYWWYAYEDKMDTFLTETDVKNTFQEILINGGDGIIIWGVMHDLNNKKKCEKLEQYLSTILGPIAFKVMEAVKKRTPLNF